MFDIKFNSNIVATYFPYLNPQPDWLTLEFFILFLFKKKKKNVCWHTYYTNSEEERIKDMSEKQIVQEDCKPYLFTIVCT